MKLHFKSTSNKEGFRAGQSLDIQSINLGIDLALCTPERAEAVNEEQPDGSVIVTINNIGEDTRQRILKTARQLCGWGDMQFEELE